MANLSITASEVFASADAGQRNFQGVAGESITAGQYVYQETGASPAVYKLADADIEGKAATAVALNSADEGQPIAVVMADDDFTPGATLVPGTVYYGSATAGAACPAEDLVAGNYVTALFIAKDEEKARLIFKRGGQVPDA